MASPEPIDYYGLLAIEPESDDDKIRRAILEQKRKWLRRQNAPSVERQRQAEDQLRAIADAEQELLDPGRRKTYDHRLAASLAKPVPPIAQPVEAPPTTTAPPPPPPREPAIDWIGRATDELRRGDLRSARYSSAEATERNPRNAAAWSIRGTVSKAQNRYEEAVFEFGEASRLAPSAAVFFNLGEANEAAGYPDQARAALQTAMQMDSANPHYAIALANCWVRQNRPDIAVEILGPVQQRNPQNARVANTLGYAILYRVETYLTRLGDGSFLFTSAQQVEQAQTELHQALSLPLDDHDLINRLSVKVTAAGQASQKRWVFPPGNGLGRTLGWFFLILLAFVTPPLMVREAFPGLLLLIAAIGFVIWTFFKVYRKPGWAKNAAKSRPYVQRWGI